MPIGPGSPGGPGGPKGPVLPGKPGLPGSPFAPLGPRVAEVAGMPVGQWGVKRSQCQWQDTGRGSSSPLSWAGEGCCLSPASHPPALSTEDVLYSLQTKEDCPQRIQRPCFNSLRGSLCSLTWLAFGSLQPIPAILAWHTGHAWQAWSPIAAVSGISGHGRPQIQE